MFLTIKYPYTYTPTNIHTHVLIHRTKDYTLTTRVFTTASMENI